MTNTPLSTTEAALLSTFGEALGTEISKLEPNNGYGLQGEWPAPGIHDLKIVGLDFEQVGRKFKGGTTPVELQGLRIFFSYETLQVQPGKTKVSTFRGKDFFLIPNPSLYPTEGQRTAQRINAERLAGHFAVILGRPASANTVADLIECRNKITRTGAAVMVAARIEFREWGEEGAKRTDRTEYLQELISG